MTIGLKIDTVERRKKKSKNENIISNFFNRETI